MLQISLKSNKTTNLYSNMNGCNNTKRTLSFGEGYIIYKHLHTIKVGETIEEKTKKKKEPLDAIMMSNGAFSFLSFFFKKKKRKKERKGDKEYFWCHGDY